MTNLKALLKTRLKGPGKIALLAVGSELRGDDAAGLMVAAAVAKKTSSRRLKIFLGATAPENLTGEIRAFGPKHIIIVDTAEMKEPPGTVLLLKPEDLSKDITFSTHKMPAEVLIEYFIKSLGSSITFIGIQPATLKFGAKASADVRRSANEVASAIVSSLEA